jgi:hypothetical protein
MAFGKSKKKDQKDIPTVEIPKTEIPKVEPKNSAPAVIIPPAPAAPVVPAKISEREKCAREIEALGNDRTGFVREEFLAAAKMLRSK